MKMKDLTNSNIDRQNILNNHYALSQIQEYIGLPGMIFEGEYRFTKEMVANFFEIDISTIDRYLTKYEAELKHNGYILTKGKQLKDIKLQFDHLIDKASKTRQLGLFNFRALLNLSMLLVESEKARHLRSKILDIVIHTINEKTGGGTKYINRRDEDYLINAIREHKYRKEKGPGVEVASRKKFRRGKPHTPKFPNSQIVKVSNSLKNPVSNGQNTLHS